MTDLSRQQVRDEYDREIAELRDRLRPPGLTLRREAAREAAEEDQCSKSNASKTG